jgi:hypothetical protein
VTQEEIKQGFADAGWELDGSFHKHPIIGCTEELSILAYRQAWEAEEDNPELQLCDHENDLSCWVSEIVTPQRAAQLLLEYGQPVPQGIEQ